MQIETRTSLARAHKVLKLVKKLVEKLPDNLSISLMGYENGRESGLHLNIACDFACSWAEHRSSDQIVVYIARWDQFSSEGRILSEEAYKQRYTKYYFDSEAAAARHIAGFLKTRSICVAAIEADRKAKV